MSGVRSSTCGTYYKIQRHRLTHDSRSIIFVHGLGGHPRTTWEDDALIEGKSDESERAQGKPGKRNVIRLGFLGRYTKKDKEREAPSGAEKTFWPRDFLAEDIPEARIYTYGYNADAYAGIFKPSNKLGIHGHARDLAIKIDREIDNEVSNYTAGINIRDKLLNLPGPNRFCCTQSGWHYS